MRPRLVTIRAGGRDAPSVTPRLVTIRPGARRGRGGPSTMEHPFCAQPAQGPWTSHERRVHNPPGNVDDPPPSVDPRAAKNRASRNRLTTTSCDAMDLDTTTSCGFRLDPPIPPAYSSRVAPPPIDPGSGPAPGPDELATDPGDERRTRRQGGRPRSYRTQTRNQPIGTRPADEAPPATAHRHHQERSPQHTRERREGTEWRRFVKWSR